MTTPERPSQAGVYDAALGGTAHSAADQELVERVREVMPDVIEGAWANRGFLQRAARWLAAEQGIRQFIDLGSGMPTQNNTHEVVQAVAPGSRVVYVDSDPRVIAVAEPLLADVEGVTLLQADLRKPADILEHPETRALVDFAEPVAVLVAGVIHFLPDSDDPWGLVRRYVDAIPPGSYLALSSITADKQEESWESVNRVGSPLGFESHARSYDEIARFFEGLELVPPYPGAKPALAYVGLWGAEDPEQADDDGSRLAYAAVARKP